MVCTLTQCNLSGTKTKTDEKIWLGSILDVNLSVKGRYKIDINSLDVFNNI
jgi:hypothetical protein